MADRLEVQEFELWSRLEGRRVPLSFEVELTARCNNHCRHCYINLAEGDVTAAAAELTCGEIVALAREAAGMGALWCLLTGGEPLLREDFEEVYLALKRLGLLVGVFTNACLVTPERAALFRDYPPRDVEVTVYGVTRETYERVTRRPGSFDAFVRGLGLLHDAGVPVRLKAMALRSNVHEFAELSAFCRERTADFYRFDPLLHLRFDGDEARNREIRAERLRPHEVVGVERADEERFGALRRGCHDGGPVTECDHLFHCGAGRGGFTIGYDGTFRLCSSLWHPDTTVNVRPDAPGALSLREAWERWVPRVLELRGSDAEFLDKCRVCDIINLCLWCPAHAALETGRMDAWVQDFCEVAHARAAAVGGEGTCRP